MREFEREEEKRPSEEAMPFFVFERRRDIELEVGFILAGQLVVDFPRGTKLKKRQVRMINQIMDHLKARVLSGQMSDDARGICWRGGCRPANAVDTNNDEIMTAWANRSHVIGVRINDPPNRAQTIEADLAERQEKNRIQMKFERELERVVLNFNIDWAEFDRRVEEASEHAGNCDNDYTQTEKILTSMELNDDKIEMILMYLSMQGGDCDCEVAMNVKMSPRPKPLVYSSCDDCGADYDEFYMVNDDIWESHSNGDRYLCIGCLEARLGRKLFRQDFTNVPVGTEIDRDRSLRLQDRLDHSMPMPEGGAFRMASRGE